MRFLPAPTIERLVHSRQHPPRLPPALRNRRCRCTLRLNHSFPSSCFASVWPAAAPAPPRACAAVNPKFLCLASDVNSPAPQAQTKGLSSIIDSTAVPLVATRSPLRVVLCRYCEDMLRAASSLWPLSPTHCAPHFAILERHSSEGSFCSARAAVGRVPGAAAHHRGSRVQQIGDPITADRSRSAWQVRDWLAVPSRLQPCTRG